MEVFLDALGHCSGGHSSITSLVGGVRNPGMFFLRLVALHEAGGEEFLCQKLRKPPLEGFRWSLVDSRIAAFITADKLPQVTIA